MEPITEVRLDKYLWAIRIYKSRSIATEAIDGGKVKLESKSLSVADMQLSICALGYLCPLFKFIFYFLFAVLAQRRYRLTLS